MCSVALNWIKMQVKQLGLCKIVIGIFQCLHFIDKMINPLSK